MAKKKAKRKKPLQYWDLTYTIGDKDTTKRLKTDIKKIWETARKREKQLDKIIALLEKILKAK